MKQVPYILVIAPALSSRRLSLGENQKAGMHYSMHALYKSLAGIMSIVLVDLFSSSQLIQ